MSYILLSQVLFPTNILFEVMVHLVWLPVSGIMSPLPPCCYNAVFKWGHVYLVDKRNPYEHPPLGGHLMAKNSHDPRYFMTSSNSVSCYCFDWEIRSYAQCVSSAIHSPKFANSIHKRRRTDRRTKLKAVTLTVVPHESPPSLAAGRGDSKSMQLLADVSIARIQQKRGAHMSL